MFCPWRRRCLGSDSIYIHIHMIYENSFCGYSIFFLSVSSITSILTAAIPILYLPSLHIGLALIAFHWNHNAPLIIPPCLLWRERKHCWLDLNMAKHCGDREGPSLQGWGASTGLLHSPGGTGIGKEGKTAEYHGERACTRQWRTEGDSWTLQEGGTFHWVQLPLSKRAVEPQRTALGARVSSTAWCEPENRVDLLISLPDSWLLESETD